MSRVHTHTCTCKKALLFFPQKGTPLDKYLYCVWSSECSQYHGNAAVHDSAFAGHKPVCAQTGSAGTSGRLLQLPDSLFHKMNYWLCPNNQPDHTASRLWASAPPCNGIHDIVGNVSSCQGVDALVNSVSLGSISVEPHNREPAHTRPHEHA